MSNTLQTELQIRINGVAEAVKGLNDVSSASRKMSESAESHNAKLSKFAGHLGGAGRYEFMLFSGIEEALEGANGKFSTFAANMGRMGLWAGAAITVAEGFKQIGESLKEINKNMEAAGYKDMNALDVMAMSLGFGPIKDPERMAAREDKVLKAFLKSASQIGNPLSFEQQLAAFASQNKADILADPTILRDYAVSLRETIDAQKEEAKSLLESAARRDAWSREQANKENAIYEKIAKKADEDKFLGLSGTAEQRFLEMFTRGGLEFYGKDFQTQAAHFFALEEKALKDRQAQERVRQEFLRPFEHDISRGPQYAGMITSGSYDERKLLDRSSWQETWKDELKTANAYLATIAAKVGTTEVYGF